MFLFFSFFEGWFVLTRSTWVRVGEDAVALAAAKQHPP